MIGTSHMIGRKDFGAPRPQFRIFPPYFLRNLAFSENSFVRAFENEEKKNGMCVYGGREFAGRIY